MDYFNPDVVSAQDYYPFGMMMVGREYGDSSYRYGFNGKENDNEVKGEGNQVDFGERMYDSRIGRWLSLDPLMKKYPSESPYLYTAANPIVFKDPDGKDRIITINLLTNNGSYTVFKVTIAGEFHYSSKRHYGPPWDIVDFFKHDIHETYTINLSDNVNNFVSKSIGYSNMKRVGAGEYLKRGVFGISDNSYTRSYQDFGFVLTGNDGGTAWDLYSDAGIKEHIDLELFMNAASAWRDVAATGDKSVFPELHDALGDLLKDKGIKSEFLEKLLNFVDKLDDVSDATDAIRNANGGSFPTGMKDLPEDMKPSPVHDTIESPARGIKKNSSGEVVGWDVFSQYPINSSDPKKPDTIRTIKYKTPKNK